MSTLFYFKQIGKRADVLQRPCYPGERDVHTKGPGPFSRSGAYYDTNVGWMTKGLLIAQYGQALGVGGL